MVTLRSSRGRTAVLERSPPVAWRSRNTSPKSRCRRSSFLPSWRPPRLSRNRRRDRGQFPKRSDLSARHPSPGDLAILLRNLDADVVPSFHLGGHRGCPGTDEGIEDNFRSVRELVNQKSYE